MIGKALEMLIVVCMKNHVFKFQNQLRVQSEGGPIGLALTGEVADCYMNNWDKKFIQKARNIGIRINLYSRFKDDIFICAQSVEKGTKLENGKLIIDLQKKKDDEQENDDFLTMEILRQVADDIDPMLKFTIDIPSLHENGKLAVLDLNINLNKTEDNRIDYEYYEKPTKNCKVLLANSAINSQAKRTILTQECLRVIRNTKIELGENTRNKHLTNFMLKMKNSGYSKKYRIEILDSALKAFKKMIDDDSNGVKPLFRNRNWNKENRQLEKKNKKRNWYKIGTHSKIKYKSILFVPPTPGGELLRDLKQREMELNKDDNERIKMVEKGGYKIKNMLVKKNPFAKTKCHEKWCPMCPEKYGKFKLPCNTNNTGYRWICRTCQQNKNLVKVYEGETSRSIRIRSLEHIKALEGKKSHSFLYKHQIMEHTDDENVEFGLEITGVYHDALSRQANEAVRISSRKNSEILNSKSEFNHPPTARVVIEKKKYVEYKTKQPKL